MVTRRNALLIIIGTLLAVYIGLFVYARRRRKGISGNKSLAYFRELIVEISETIIPATNTPGAKDARVSDYVINVIEHCATARDKVVILTGLEEVEKYALRNFSKSFQMCSSKDKITTLQYFEKKWDLPHPFLNRVRRKIFGLTFFEQIKWLTVSGYCTSKLGATEGLAYEHIPIDYISCVEYSPHQRSWATN